MAHTQVIIACEDGLMEHIEIRHRIRIYLFQSFQQRLLTVKVSDINKRLRIKFTSHQRIA